MEFCGTCSAVWCRGDNLVSFDVRHDEVREEEMAVTRVGKSAFSHIL